MVSWFDEIAGNFWYSKLDVSLLFGVFLKAILEEIFQEKTYSTRNRREAQICGLK